MNIAVLEGYAMPRRRRRRTSSRRRTTRSGGAWRRKFAKAARACGRRRKGSFRACMKRALKRGRR